MIDLQPLLQKAFRLADHDGQGFLTKEKLKIAMTTVLGYYPSKFEVSQVLSSPLLNGNALNEMLFIEIMNRRQIAGGASDEELVRQMFLAFDASCNGFVSKRDFATVALQSFPHLDATLLQEYFDSADTDRDGRVSFRDFENVMSRAT